MKLRDLQQGAGTAMVWPPQWVESSGPGHSSTVAEECVLKGLQRMGNRLLLQITINGRRRTTRMEWDPPPAVGDVEVALLASIGAEIRRLGDLEVVPRETGGSAMSPHLVLWLLGVGIVLGVGMLLGRFIRREALPEAGSLAHASDSSRWDCTIPRSGSLPPLAMALGVP